MIDFRYHIVSIVSIFLALAVGIVLGAGPLQGEIGTTLQNEVAGLRKDKADLNTQLSTARAGTEARDSFLDAVSGRVYGGTLRDRGVALVVMPGSDAAVSESVVAALGTAGARVTSTTTVGEDWVSTDAKTVAARDEVVARVASDAAVDTSTGSAQPRDLLLATLLARTAPAGDNGPDDATARTGLEALADAGLVSIDAETFTRADLVVVVAGTVADGDAAARTATAEQWVALTAALDDRSRGVVVADDLAAETDGTSVLATLRDTSSATREVSSVDDAGSPLGLASVVFALVQQDGGSAGQYGLGAGTDAAYAPVPSAAASS
ncbi:copper transporter [Arthrobacter sp. NEB 688]|uniref:copper transporter n=1 Tax=Arthrobacter sp. NEB 688 TaxID=904039 RepID=UPI0015655FD4|nr:copper transporter [Arthrobacter sp. NEB 688]QKE84978.1 copper transporter [Arthrobacter sp. NEB 688]